MRILIVLCLTLFLIGCNVKDPNDAITEEIDRVFKSFNSEVGRSRDQIIVRHGLPYYETEYNRVSGLIMTYDLGEVSAQLELNKDLILQQVMAYKK